MLRTLRQRRWIGLTLAVIVASLAFYRLGLWQLHRAQAKWRLNDAIATRAHADPVPAMSVIPTDRQPDKAQEWRRVSVTGTYDTGHTVLRRDQTLNGVRGFDVLVPLDVDGGAVLYVDRGFVPAGATVRVVPDVPAPPSGAVTVTGLVRRPSSAPLRLDRSIAIPTVRAVAPQRLAAEVGLGGSVLDAYLMRVAEDPAPANVPAPPDLPTQDVGLNLAYMVQWWLFIAIAVGGWFVLLRRDAQDETAGGAKPDDAVSRSHDVPAQRA